MPVPAPTGEPDPLKEPRDARARLRALRQAEAAAKYNASYERRVAGGLLSCRETQHPVPSYKVSTHVDAMADTQVVGPVVHGAPAKAAPAMEGRAVNVYGQTLDHAVPAIQQIMNGAFYTVRGNAVPELYAKKEGKYMRFRAPPVPEATPKEAATMTKIAGKQGSSLLGLQKKGASCDVAVDATTTSDGLRPFDLDAALSQARKDHAKRTSPPAYMKRTLSSQRKVADPPLTSRSHDSTNAPLSARPATSTATQKPPKSSFETALEKQKRHGPGEAVVIDENELQRILEIAGKTNFNAQQKRPESARPRGQFTGFA